MKLYLKNNWLSILMLLSAVAFAAYLYPSLPSQIPSHFNFRGEPDSFQSKWFAVVLLPALNAFVLVFLPLLVIASPRHYQMEDSQRALARVNFALTFLLCGLYVIILRNSALQRADQRLPAEFAVVLSIFMIFLGNYLSKVERNFFAGIRTPWTLASEKNWLATHRFAARAFVILGVLSAILSMTLHQIYWPVISILTASLMSAIYSFYFFSRFEKSQVQS